MKLQVDERLRDGLFAAGLTIVAALMVRYLVANPQDYLHYRVLGELTAVDFGTWPGIFYTGGGGDGEVFAVLAADPLGNGPSQLIPAVIYRFQHVGYSWIAWAFSLGQDRLVLPSLFTVGLLSVGGVGFMSGFLRDRLGFKSWILALNPALYIGFIGDTVEPLAMFFLLIAMTGSGYWAAAALGITRPTYAAALVGHWKHLAVAAAAGIMILMLAVWLFDGSAFANVEGALGPPFAAYFEHASMPGFLVLTSGIATLAVGTLRKDLAWIASGALVVVLGPAVVEFPNNAIRAAGLLPLLWALGPGWIPANLRKSTLDDVATS